MSTRLLAVVLVPLLAAGCGGGSDKASTQKAAPTATTAAVTPSPTPSPTPTPAQPKTGAEVVAALKTAGLPVTLTVDYDENTDPNKLLGRPNGYLDKAAFTDARIKKADVIDADPGSVELGGSVEVFATQQDAQTRADYMQRVTKGTPALVEYDYVKGGVLLRLSKNLTPTQAKAYEAAL